MRPEPTRLRISGFYVSCVLAGTVFAVAVGALALLAVLPLSVFLQEAWEV